MDTDVEHRYYTKTHYPFFWTFFVWFSIDAFLESVSVNPTKQEQDEIYSWMYLTLRRIPCFICRDHALQLYNAYPINATSKEAAQQWWSEFHNLVNQKLGKPQLTTSEIQQVHQLTRHVYWPQLWKDLQDHKFAVQKPKPVSSRQLIFFIVLVFVILVCTLLGFFYYRRSYFELLRASNK